MLKYQIYQSKLEGSMSYGKWYARVVSTETIGLMQLADHMRTHNTPYSTGTIKGILEDAVNCVRELLLEGKRVQLDGLASFGLSIMHKSGAAVADDFSVRKNVKAVKLVAQGIGEFSKSMLTSAGKLSESNTYVSPKSGMSDSGSGSEEDSGTTIPDPIEGEGGGGASIPDPIG